MKRAWFAAAFAFAFAFAGDGAHGYVRSRTQNGPGIPIKWPGTKVTMIPVTAASPDLDLAAVKTIFQISIDQWANTAGGCSYLTLELGADKAMDAHYDMSNVLVFRTDRWCHPNDEKSKDVCYDKSAAAITTVFYVDNKGGTNDGNIVDADIEFNNLDFTFADVSVVTAARPGTSLADLENTAVHEIGHLMGLDHTCKDANTPANEVDENGNPPTSCSALASLSLEERRKITDATMFNSASPGETKKRDPSSDDVAGICNAYPVGTPPTTDSPGPCSMSTRGDVTVTGALALGLLALALTTVRARRLRVATAPRVRA